MKLTIDTDTDSFASALHAVHAAYGVTYAMYGDSEEAEQNEIDADNAESEDDGDEYTREDFESMSMADLKGIAMEAGYTESDIKGLSQDGLIDFLLDTGEESEDGDDDFFPGKWNRKRIRKLAQWVHGGDAAEALRFMAQNAPAVGLDEALAHMAKFTGIDGFNGQHLGGRMSSVGFAQNSIGAGVGDIYDTDYKHRKYRMDKGIAKVLLEELDALD